MFDLSISEFKKIVNDMADKYPEAIVDFAYPMRRAGKKTSVRGEMTGFELLRSSKPILRFRIEYAHGVPENETA